MKKLKQQFPGMKRTYIILFSAFLVVSALSSCATSTTTAESSANDSLPVSSSAQWVIVSENPITFFPKGLPSDAKTDFADGEWVYSKERGARWFIPKGGVGNRTTAELSAEALSMRTEGEKRRSALRESGDSIAGVGVNSFWTSVLLMGGVLEGIGGGDGSVAKEGIKRVWEWER